MAAVTVEGVSKHYRGFEAIGDLSLQIPAHKLVALIGHNGAGKTTLMKMMLGITRPSSGVIRLWGDEVRPGNEHSDQIGFLPEVFNFNTAMTGAEALRFLASLKSRPGSECKELLSQVGLSEAADRRIKTYSKGMRQRLGLAQALLGNPRLLVLDEPTTGLDPELRGDFFRILGERCQQGATVIISTHSLYEIETHADQVVILRRGKMVASGPVDALCERFEIPTRIEVELVSAQAMSALQAALSEYPCELLGERRLRIECIGVDRLKGLKKKLFGSVELTDIRFHPPRLEAVYRKCMDGGEG